MEKTIKHTAKNGILLTINCSIKKGRKISIEIIGEGVTHKYPKSSRVAKDVLYPTGATYKGKKIGGLRDIIGIQEWYNKANDHIAELKKIEREEQILKDKREEFVNFSTSNDKPFTSNKYLDSLGFNNLTPIEGRRMIAISQQKGESDIRDYSIESEYTGYLVALESELENIKAEKAKKREKKTSIKPKYKNLYLVDVDMSSGLEHYAFMQKVDKHLFNKVRHLFSYVESGVNDFDPMGGSNFKGYTTTQPQKVVELLA